MGSDSRRRFALPHQVNISRIKKYIYIWEIILYKIQQVHQPDEDAIKGRAILEKLSPSCFFMSPITFYRRRIKCMVQYVNNIKGDRGNNYMQCNDDGQTRCIFIDK